MWIEATIQLQKAHLHLGGHGIVDIFEHLWAIVNDCDFMIGLCALSWLGFQGQIRWLKGNSIYLTRFWHDLCMSEIEFFASQPQYHAMSSSKMLEHQKNRMNKIDETTVFPQSPSSYIKSRKLSPAGFGEEWLGRAGFTAPNGSSRPCAAVGSPHVYSSWVDKLTLWLFMLFNIAMV